MEHATTSAEIVIVLNSRRVPVGKLASAEISFTGGLLDGLRLVGFGIWKRSSGGQNVTLPSRQYLQNGQLRMFSLLQPSRDDGSYDRLRQAILAEYDRVVGRQRPSEDEHPEFPDLPRP